MKNKINKAIATSNLREKAALMLKEKTLKAGSVLVKPLPSMELLHESAVQQVELEMQHDALTSANVNTKRAMEEYAVLCDMAPFGYFTLSREGKIIDLNAYGSEILGEDRSRLRNMHFSFFVAKDSKPIFLHFLKKLFDNNSKEDCEINLDINEGFPTQFQLTGLPIEHGEQCLLTVIDITNRKLISEATQKKASLFKTLAEVAPVGIFHTDNTGYTTYVNPSWCRITGLTDKEALGNNWLKAVHEADQIQIKKTWKDAVKNKDRSISEYRFIRKDGSIAWVMGQAIPETDLNNQVLGYVGTITDITERKLLEEKQQEVQGFLEETQRIANIGTYKLDIASGTWSSSEVLNEIFGISTTVEKSIELWSAIVHPEWRKIMTDYFEKEVIGNKKQFNKEYKIIRINDQAERWVHGIGRLRFNSNNQPITMVGTIQDITQRKQLEIEIVQSKERAEASNASIKNYLDNAPDGVFVVDEAGNYMEVNPAATTITGYSKEELLAFSIRDLTPPGSMDAAFNHFNTLLQTGSSKGDIQFIHKTGEIRWYSVEAVKLSEHRFLGFVKDITERKKGEAEIIISNERFELMAKATNDGLWDWNLETNFLWANEIHQQLFGLTINDPVPIYTEWAQRIHPEDRDRTIKAFESARTSQKNSHVEEYRFYAENNGWIHVYGRTLIERNQEGKAVRLIGSMMDITENKKAEAALKDAEKRLNFLLSATPAVIYSAQAEYPFGATFISENITEQTGHKAEEFINDPTFWSKNIHPDDQQRVMHGISNLFEYCYHKHEYRFKIKDGSYLWMHDEARLIFDITGKPVEMVGYWINIDERKKAEAAIIASEEKYRSLVEQASDAIFVADPNGRFITVNSSLCRLSGFTEKELLKMSIHDFTIIEDLQKNPLHFTELKQGKTVITERLMQGKKDIGYVQINAKILENGNLLVFVADITERKRAQKALAESENRLRTIYNTEPECIKLLGAKAELLEINPAGLEMIEADNFEQVKGKSVLGIVNEPFRKAYKKLINNVFKEKSGVLEFEITGLKGTTRWLETHAVPLKNTKGEIISFLGVTRDVSERKKIEEKIKNTNEQLRHLTAHLQSIREEERLRIGREIHDELGQQLTAIKMDVVWMDKKIPEETTALKIKLKNIITLLDGSNQSIRRILSELRPVILDDFGLLEALSWLGSQFTTNTGIPVNFTTTQTAVKIPAPIATCIFRIYQEALTNITRHANAKMIATSLSFEDGEIIVTIVDDGKGFRPNAVQNKQSFGILGMKERVLSLNGKFELISAPKKGTKIILTLPNA